MEQFIWTYGSRGVGIHHDWKHVSKHGSKAREALDRILTPCTKQ